MLQVQLFSIQGIHQSLFLIITILKHKITHIDIPITYSYNRNTCKRDICEKFPSISVYIFFIQFYDL